VPPVGRASSRPAPAGRLDRVQIFLTTTRSVRKRAVVHPASAVLGQHRMPTIDLGPMPDFVADELREHVEAFPSPERLVFTSAQGTPLRHRNFMRRHFKPAVVRAGLPEQLRFHDLRHTAAALFIAEGATMEQVKRPARDAHQRRSEPALIGGSSWSGRRDSNPRPSPWQGDALPAEPRPRGMITLASPAGAATNRFAQAGGGGGGGAGA
jgi:Phage integrase family